MKKKQDPKAGKVQVFLDRGLIDKAKAAEGDPDVSTVGLCRHLLADAVRRGELRKVTTFNPDNPAGRG